MDEQACKRLIGHIDERMRELGMADLAATLNESVPANVDSSQQRLLMLLDTLETEMRLHDAGTARAVSDRLARVASTPDGEPVTEMWVDLAPAHRDAYGVDEVNLGVQQDMTAQLEDLQRVRVAVRGVERGGWA